MSVRDWPEAGHGVDLDELLSALPDTVVQVDNGLRIAGVNHPESAVFKCRPTVGDSLDGVFDPDAATMISSLVERSPAHGTAEGQHDTGARLFRVFVTTLTSSPMTLIVFQDITVRRDALRALTDSLGDKGGVLRSVGHRLAEPLIAVLGYAGLLSGSSEALDSLGRRAIVEHMTDQAWMLAGMIEDMMTLAESETGDLKTVGVPVNLSANVAQVIEPMGARGSDVLLTGDRQVVALGDPARVRQIIRILLSNAHVHGAEPVGVKVSSINGSARLSVSDRGPGISLDMERQIFRVLPTVASRDGSPVRGIGLWVANELARLMNGALSYGRESGLTVFSLTLPVFERH